MKKISLNIDHVFDFVSKETIYDFRGQIDHHLISLHSKTGKGSDFLGWLDLPSSISDDDIKEINETVENISQDIDIMVVVGIGGSYLGAKAVIEALSNSFEMMKPKNDKPLVLFAGQNIGEDYLFELLEVLRDKSYGITVISKSGTTTEPAIAFRLLKRDLELKVGKKEAAKRIVAITDKSKGALRQLADKEGYKSFIIPDDVGGRFSVLTPVGLVPIAFAGFDIQQFVEGAKFMENETGININFKENPASLYAAARNALYKHGRTNEILVNYNPKLAYIAEWWKQLYGESEGKEHKGIFPASVNFTTDLHSLGQYIQDGLRNIFETVISVKNTQHELHIPKDDNNLDKLNYLAGKRIDEVNKMAELGTMLAHIDGGVPNIKIEMERIDEAHLGQLLFIFEKACGLSGYTLGVNPFDQPGVEAYKRNMFALLQKPGIEEETQKINMRIKKLRL